MSRVFLLAKDPLDALRQRAALEAGSALKVCGIASLVQRARRMIEDAPPDVLIADLTLQDGPLRPLLRALGSAARPKVLVRVADAEDPALFDALCDGANALWIDGDAPDAVHRLLCGQTQMPASVAAQLLLHFDRRAGSAGDAFDVVDSIALDAGETALLALVADGTPVADIGALDGTLPQTVQTRLFAVVRKLHWDVRTAGLTLQAA